MKYLALCLAAVLAGPVYAEKEIEKGIEKGADQGQEVPVPDQGEDQGQELIGEAMDAEELQVYTIDTKAQKPMVVVLRVDMENGKRAILHAEQEMPPEPLKDDVLFTDVEYSDDVEWDDSVFGALSLTQYRSTWHHNRYGGWGYYHRYRGDHPYGSYYGRYYRGTPYRYHYPRTYYHYRPYHGYRVGNLIYRFFKEIFD